MSKCGCERREPPCPLEATSLQPRSEKRRRSDGPSDQVPKTTALSSARGAVALLGLTFIAASCAQEPPQVQKPPQLRPVKSLTVHSQGGPRTRTFTGLSKADTRSEFAFRVSGTVQKVSVEEGEPLKKGDLIAEIDPVDLDIQMKEIEATLAEAKAQAVLANSNFQRIQRLYEKDNVSQGDFESALAQRESAQARVDSVATRLQQSKRQIAYARLFAPVDCAVVSVKVEEGESVQAGVPVVEVVTGGNPQVAIAVPEMIIAEISKGMSARVTFPAVPDRTFLGHVTTVAIVPSEGLTTYPVTIELDTSWDQLRRRGSIPVRPGMAVEARLDFPSVADAKRHIVPSNAVLADAQGQFVFVLESASDDTARARRRGVETGRLLAAGVEVLSGLSDGDRVIIAGVSQIQDGQAVRPLTRD